MTTQTKLRIRKKLHSPSNHVCYNGFQFSTFLFQNQGFNLLHSVLFYINMPKCTGKVNGICHILHKHVDACNMLNYEKAVKHIFVCILCCWYEWIWKIENIAISPQCNAQARSAKNKTHSCNNMNHEIIFLLEIKFIEQ